VVPAAGGPAPRRRVTDLPEPTWRLLLGRGLPQFALEAVVPVLAFYAGLQAAGLAAGIIATSVVSVAIAAGLVRRGRDVSLVALGVVFVAIQAAAGLVSGSTTVYLAQPVVFSALAGVAYALSVVIGRPLIGVFASAWYPFPEWFRETAAFRREFGLQSLVWAGYCFLRAGLRLAVLLRNGVGGYVVVSVATGVPGVVALIGWGIWHARRTFADVAAEPADGERHD
jgi:uncharacterized protein DUF3159